MEITFKGMGEKTKEYLVRWVPIFITILFWYFGVIKENERKRIEIIYLQKTCEVINIQIEKLEQKKVDKETFNLLLVSIGRIENKLDKLQNN